MPATDQINVLADRLRGVRRFGSSLVEEILCIENENPEISVSDWQLSRKAAATLASWHTIPDVVVAAMIVPLLRYGNAPVATLALKYGRDAVALAERLILHYSPLTGYSDFKSPGSSAAGWLRRLFREAYIEAPRFRLLLLILAYHKAELLYCVKPLPKRIAQLTESTLVPLAQMLGIWSLVRSWLEESAIALHEDEYRRLERVLGPEEAYTQKGIESLLLFDPVEKAQRHLKDKAEVYQALATQIERLSRAQAMHPRPRIYPIRPLPGVALRRHRSGESEQDLATRIRVRVLCHTVGDCYRVLGIVHSLGKPVAPRFFESFNDFVGARFVDYIASPLPNGYQSLHTTVMVESDSRCRTLVEFRILTPAMLRLNDYGVIAAFNWNPRKYESFPAWWNWENHECLRGGTTQTTLIPQNELDTESDPLYVFSPLGEVKFLPRGSTALDFAYHVHTELAHHASGIEVNGERASLGYPLKNGDIVRVHYGGNTSGPDLSWLQLVTTRRSRENLRRGLTRNARAVHEGRARLEKTLIKRLQRYRRRNGSDWGLTRKQFGAFLSRTSRAKNLSGVDELYKSVESGDISADRIVRVFFSEQLSENVLQQDGSRLRHLPQRILFCELCHPSPSDSIVGLEHRRGNITIHREGNSVCPPDASTHKLIPLRWSERLESEGLLQIFQVEALDRHQLLKELMQVVYDEQNAYLHKVTAQVDSNGHASIILVVRADDLAHVTRIRGLLEAVTDVKEVWQAPPAQHVALSSSSVTSRVNPYSTLEVFDRARFYDREELIQKLLDWIAKPPENWLIVHGQRRVGKTSLLLRFANKIVPSPGTVIPAFIDLQLFGFPFEARSFARLIVQTLYKVLEMPTPELKADDEPMVWLKSELERAVELTKGHRLLLIIDEFNVLCDLAESGDLHKSLFDNLRGVMAAIRNVNWILIVQDTHFRDSEKWGNAEQIFSRSITLQVTHLPSVWARKLIVDPFKRCGVTYQSERLIRRVLYLTGGNPYFINLLSHHLFERLKALKASLIRPEDLQEQSDLLVHDGACTFDHYIRKITNVKTKLILSVIGASNRKWSDEQYIGSRLDDYGVELSLNTIRSCIAALEYQGMLIRRQQGRREIVRIPIGLFELWVKHNLAPQDVVDELRITDAPVHGL